MAEPLKAELKKSELKKYIEAQLIEGMWQRILLSRPWTGKQQ